MTAPTGSLAHLDPYALDVGDRVTVDLLVTEETGRSGDLACYRRPVRITGTVKAASAAVLVLDGSIPPGVQPHIVRVPWSAIAVIADALDTSHPGLD